VRDTQFEFVRIGKRWINMSMVTDVRDCGDKIFVFLSAPMLGSVGDQKITGGRRIVIKDPDEVVELRKWMTLHD
jgi:hypothetical protein